jgi:hypothetical protein
MFGGHYFDRKITKEQYDRAMANGGYLTEDDAKVVLNDAERFGYGATARRVEEKGGEYYVSCHMYNHCD